MLMPVRIDFHREGGVGVNTNDKPHGPAMSAARPCPYCGSRSVAMSPPVNDGPDDPYDFLNLFQVVCMNDECGASGPPKTTAELAFMGWNGEAKGMELLKERGGLL